MAKLTRESRLRERRAGKQAKKEARRNAPPIDPDAPAIDPDQSEDIDAPQPLTGSLSEPEQSSQLTQP